MLMKNIGSRIVSRRKELGLKGKELAERVGCHPPDISDWEKSKNVPSVESLIKLARALNTTETWLASGKGPKNPGDGQVKSKITQLPVENSFRDAENNPDNYWEAEMIKDKNQIIELQQEKIELQNERIRGLEARLAQLEEAKGNKPSKKQAG
jgi:transcriptional regulator with XRE-family HTH domain